jgi:hypothetical protein
MAADAPLPLAVDPPSPPHATSIALMHAATTHGLTRGLSSILVRIISP